jgi:tRNA nucleotidyltransferase/poly(A) polymerase
MFSFLFSSWGKYIAMGLVLALLLGGAFIYIKTSQAQIERLSRQLAETQIALESSNKIIEEQQKNAARQAELMQSARQQFLRAEQARAELQRMIAQSNLQRNAASNPSEIQRAVNAWQEEMRRSLEALSQVPGAATATTPAGTASAAPSATRNRP